MLRIHTNQSAKTNHYSVTYPDTRSAIILSAFLVTRRKKPPWVLPQSMVLCGAAAHVSAVSGVFSYVSFLFFLLFHELAA